MKMVAAVKEILKCESKQSKILQGKVFGEFDGEINSYSSPELIYSPIHN